MKINHLFKIRELSEKDEIIINQIEGKIARTSKDEKKTEESLNVILNVIHQGFNIDPIKYLDQIFFDFHIIIQRTLPQKTRIYYELKEIKKFPENTIEEKTQLVNVYRNIVSDLFDPYINLIIATFQFIEGTFENIQQTNLGASELNKYEYAYSRLKPTNLFEGYSSIVRNAISHTGTESIIYEKSSIIFKSIKRGIPPTINYVKWTTEQLRNNILQLLEFIHAIDNCIEIFGFDAGDLITNNKELSHKFLDEVLNKEQRFEIQGKFDEMIQKIISNPETDQKSKIESISKIFMRVCKSRNLPVKSISIDIDKSIISINLPYKSFDTNSESEIVNKTVKSIRYGIIACSMFKYYFNIYLVQDFNDDKSSSFSIVLNRENLEEYEREDAGIYDLLDQCQLYINKEKTEIHIDFDELSRIEYLELGRRFPRKIR